MDWFTIILFIGAFLLFIKLFKGVLKLALFLIIAIFLYRFFIM